MTVGIDWIAFVLVIAGWIMLPRDWKWGTVLLVTSNVLFAAWAFGLGFWSIVGLNLIFTLLNIRAAMIWAGKGDIFEEIERRIQTRHVGR